jgi:hypothetical protein
VYETACKKKQSTVLNITPPGFQYEVLNITPPGFQYEVTGGGGGGGGGA